MNDKSPRLQHSLPPATEATRELRDALVRQPVPDVDYGAIERWWVAAYPPRISRRMGDPRPVNDDAGLEEQGLTITFTPAQTRLLVALINALLGPTRVTASELKLSAGASDNLLRSLRRRFEKALRKIEDD